MRPGADLGTFSEIHFWRIDPKIFLKAPLAPIYTNFEGERAPKKTRFFCQNFSKSAQKQCSGRARKINLVDLKKKKGRQNFGNFSKIRPPPLEKILDPPLRETHNLLVADRVRYVAEILLIRG